MSSPATPETRPTARIHEQGYRRYDGTRLGPNHAIRAVYLHTLRQILGFRLRFRSKVIPVGTFALITLPGVLFSAGLLIIPEFAADVAQELLPGPERYLGGTIFLVYIAAAVAGPGALCGDRLHGSLALYLASPLTRRTYLLGKSLAVLTYLSAMTIIPSLLYVLGVAMAGVQDQTFGSVATDVVQVLAAGLFAAVGYAAVSMAGASLTDRQGSASAIIIGFAMGSAIVRQILTFGAGLDESVAVIDVNAVVGSVAFHLHVAGTGFEGAILEAPLAVGAAVAWVGALVFLVLRRYSRLQVTR